MATRSYNTRVGAANTNAHMQREADDGLEFRVFVENTEKELLALFKSIDRDDDGKLDKSELRGAFKKAGLSVPASKLDQLFAEVDQNSDVSRIKLKL
jgi:Ca2+-binding EF-hand superfamily protein